MQNNRDLLSLVKNLFSRQQAQRQLLSPKLVAIFIVGVMLMLGSHYFSVKKDAAAIELQKATEKPAESSAVEAWGTAGKASPNTKKSSLEKSYEMELAGALELMAGVSDVTVVIKLASSERKVYEKNYSTTDKETKETDKNNGKRTIGESTSDNKVVIINDGNRDIPLEIETEMPEVKGVLVVAKGMDDIVLKEKVVEAITRLFDVPSHRVAVVAR